MEIHVKVMTAQISGPYHGISATNQELNLSTCIIDSFIPLCRDAQSHTCLYNLVHTQHVLAHYAQGSRKLRPHSLKLALSLPLAFTTFSSVVLLWPLLEFLERNLLVSA